MYLYTTNIVCRSLLSLFSVPCRTIGSPHKFVYPWVNRRKPYWVDQKADPLLDEQISQENAQFLLEERRRLTTNSPLSFSSMKNTPWIPLITQRCGLVGVKLGIYPLWTKEGKKIDCTLVQIPDNHVIRYVPPNEVGNYLSLRDPRGYWISNTRLPSWITNQRWGLQMVGCMSADPLEFTPAWCGLFTNAGVAPKRKICRFLVSPDAALEPGTPLSIHHFRVGDYVDVTARTINRGFQGVIERWGMKGGPAAHGSTKFHRRIGSLAGGGKKIIRGKHMHGVMGNRYRSLRGLQILRINPRLNLIYLSGPTPGPVHSFCQLNDSWLINRQHEISENPPPTPTWFSNSLDPLDAETEVVDGGTVPDRESLFEDFKDDIFHDSIHRYDEPSINHQNKT